MFEITFEKNGVYQVNMVEAASLETAKNFFEAYKPEAIIIDARENTSRYIKPGMPILKA